MAPLADFPVARRGRYAVAAVLVAFAAAAAAPVGDIDYGWHVASGQWIIEHRALPETDPFGVFGDADPVRALTVLKGQWLGQVLLAAAHRGLGEAGAVLLRALALAAAALTVAVRARRLGAPWLATTVSSGLVCLGLLGFTGERPQTLTYLLLGLVLLALESGLARHPRRLAVAMAAIGVIWANLHGSVLLGGLLVLGMALVESLVPERVLPGDRRPRPLWIAGLILIASVALAPNGLRSFAFVLRMHSSELGNRTSEWASSLSLAAFSGPAAQARVLVVLAAALIALLPLLRRSPTRAAALLALTGASVISHRYHAFLLVGAGPWIAEGLGVLERRFLGEERHRVVALTAAAGLAFAGGTFAVEPPMGVLTAPIAPHRFPMAASAFMQQVGLRGRALVWFAWSGFVLWRNAPAVTPFIDPRMLDDAPLRPYTHMIWATPEGLAALESERIELVLLPYFSNAGEPYPLHLALAGDPRWRIAFAWDRGALYQRVR